MGTSRKLIFVEGMPPHLMLRLRNKKLVNELTKDQLALLFPEVCWWKDQCSTASREGSCSPGAAAAVGAELCDGCEWIRWALRCSWG